MIILDESSKEEFMAYVIKQNAKYLTAEDEAKQAVERARVAYNDKLAEYEKKNKTVKLDTLEREVASVLLEADFGCQRKHVERLMNLLVGSILEKDINFHKIIESLKKSPMPKEPDYARIKAKIMDILSYTILVAKDCNNSHNYGIDIPFLTHGDGRKSTLLKMDGDYGNHLGDGTAWEPATEKQIKLFFEEVPWKIIMRYIN